ncbi:MAG: serine hydrolase [Minwuia sp.]|nr:serine hydrolase [Minwuia sp.]
MMQQQLDALLQTATESHAVPGVSAVVTNSNGNTYAGAFGERVKGSGDRMTTDTVVWIASMTKAITGAAAMQLVEQGRLDLDAPARDTVSDIGGLQVLDNFDPDGQPVLRAPKSDITLRQLLTHSAGCTYDMWSADIQKFMQVSGTPPIISCMNAALNLPLMFDPGTNWDYGTGIDWAGKMVEQVSGQTLGAYMADNLFAPMGMDSTAFRMTDDMRGRMAKIHARTEDDQLVAQMDLEIPQDPEFEMGGGGLYGTVEDYAKFVRMILNKGQAGGNQVLKPETVAMMSVNQMGDNRVSRLVSAEAGFTNDAEFFPGIEKTWGLSFMINEQQAPTGRSAGSLAWAGLANSYYWIDPVKGIGGVYATQILPFADVKSLPLFLEFEKTVYDNLN